MQVNGEALNSFRQHDEASIYDATMEFYNFISISGASKLPIDLYKSNAAIWAWDLGTAPNLTGVEVSNPFTHLNMHFIFSPFSEQCYRTVTAIRQPTR